MRTQGKLTLHEFMHSYHDWFVQNAVFRPNERVDDKTGEYWPVGRAMKGNKKLTMREMYMKTRGKQLATMGFSGSEIEERFMEWRKSYQGAER